MERGITPFLSGQERARLTGAARGFCVGKPLTWTNRGPSEYQVQWSSNGALQWLSREGVRTLLNQYRLDGPLDALK